MLEYSEIKKICKKNWTHREEDEEMSHLDYRYYEMDWVEYFEVVIMLDDDIWVFLTYTDGELQSKPSAFSTKAFSINSSWTWKYLANRKLEKDLWPKCP